MPNLNPILHFNSQGDEVKNLQSQLQKITGVAISKTEVDAQTFGTETAMAISEVQKKFNLAVTGVADENTLQKIGEVFNGINQRSVAGTIQLDNGLPASGLKIVVVDKSFDGQEKVLGEALLDTNGKYQIDYTQEMLGLGKNQADLELRVVDTNNLSKVVATSATVFNAVNDAGISLTIPTDAVPQPSEFAQITADLKKELGTTALKDLVETTDRHDISFLANKTGWDARMVAMVVQSEKESANTGLNSDYYYALYRAGMPLDSAALHQTNNETVAQTWQTAIDAKIITGNPDSVQSNKDKFATASLPYYLENNPTLGVSKFKDILSISLGNDENKQRDFAQMYYEHQGEMADFWTKAETIFGTETVKNIRLDGQLGFLTLNNAPLIQSLRTNGMIANTPLDLVKKGFYENKGWDNALSSAAIPADIQGANDAEKKSNYASLMSNQLRLAYPTEVLAHQIETGVLTPKSEDATVKTNVVNFFYNQEKKFVIGRDTVKSYQATHGDTGLTPEEESEVNRTIALYQTSASDKAMQVLAKQKLDAAHLIVQYTEEEFIVMFRGIYKSIFENDGVTDQDIDLLAHLTYIKAHSINSVVLNFTTSAIKEGNAPPLIGANGVKDPIAEGIKGSVSMEKLFGSLDFADCNQCESIFSPSAYLVDILKFLDLKKYDRNGLEVLPKTYKQENPLDVLLNRRPDIEHLDLTCENTNTVLPYIDIVNEILEYWVVKNADIAPEIAFLHLKDFEGHNIFEGDSTEDLLANPLYIDQTVYDTILSTAIYPTNLPFNYPLTSLRAYYNALKSPLADTMEIIQKDKEIADSWKDIYMEQLGISPQEYSILTDNTAHKNPTLFGEDPVLTIQQLNDTIGNARTFTRKMEIAYIDLVRLLKTKYINPAAALIPKLEALQTPIKSQVKENKYPDFANIQNLISGSIQFGDLTLPTNLRLEDFEGNVENWLRNNGESILGLILLTGKGDDFGNLTLQYADPDPSKSAIKEDDFLRFYRFIRIWKKIGWSIEDTDAIFSILYKAENKKVDGDNDAQILEKLDKGTKDILLKIAQLKQIQSLLKPTGKNIVEQLLCLWGNINTFGSKNLYERFFLNATILRNDSVFKANGQGEVLTDNTQKLESHKTSIIAAFNIKADELDFILSGKILKSDDVLNIENLSIIYRHAFLARSLKMKVSELVSLIDLSGLNPFDPLQDGIPTTPTTLKFIELAQKLNVGGIKISTLEYWLLNQDSTGKMLPNDKVAEDLLRTLKTALNKIDPIHIFPNPNEEEAVFQAKVKEMMGLIYGSSVVEQFFSIGNIRNQTFTATYSQKTEILDGTLPGLTYDQFKKTLSFKGQMDDAKKSALEDAADRVVDADFDKIKFKEALKFIFEQPKKQYEKFIGSYPMFKPYIDNFQKPILPDEEAQKGFISSIYHNLADNILPSFIARQKTETVKQLVANSIGLAQPMADLLFENSEIINLEEKKGLVSHFENIQDDIGLTAPTDKKTFYFEVPQNDEYNFYVEIDTTCKITLSFIDGINPNFGGDDSNFINQSPIPLQAGKLLKFDVLFNSNTSKLKIKWSSREIAKIEIPNAVLYDESNVTQAKEAYLKLWKANQLISLFNLNEQELAFLAISSPYQINTKSFFNQLVVNDSIITAETNFFVSSLIPKLLALNTFKKKYRLTGESVVNLMESPDFSDKTGLGITQLLGWQKAQKVDIMTYLGFENAQLKDIINWLKLHDFVELSQKTGLSINQLIAWTNVSPTTQTIIAVKNTLCSLYDSQGWLDTLKPINDTIRAQQRDALVAFTLQKMSTHDGTKHIDTPSKLFEFFLIDVEMGTCMGTSRIRQAISAVQLFVQRCLMNLENDILPESIKSKQWEWMKRYRVWEANRRIFIYPENWLEPELRDNKSFFFRDLEGELLQADITDEMAEKALYGYLEKLDGIAKLEIVGMYLEEQDPNKQTDDVLHVIGRTNGMSRKYYYRRFEYGFWTPWEHINLDIEDTPVLPVIWKNRLFLFWLNVIVKGQDGQPLNIKDGKAENLTSLQALVTVEINLSWSEYYKGKWQPRKTSDYNESIKITNQNRNDFNREDHKLYSQIGKDGELEISVSPMIAHFIGSFTLFNTHSNPICLSTKFDKGLYKEQRNLSTMNRGLKMGYFIPTENGDSTPIKTIYNHNILNTINNGKVTELHHELQGSKIEAPFFVEDRQHTFFVDIHEDVKLITKWELIGVYVPPIRTKPDFIPPLIVELPPKRIPKFDNPGIVERVNPVRELSNVGNVSIDGINFGRLGSTTFESAQNAQVANVLNLSLNR